MNDLALLQKKINSLIKAHFALYAEREQLRQTIQDQKAKMNQLQEKLEQLEKQVQWASTSKIIDMLDNNEKIILKQELDKVLLELEKNISLLK